MKLPDRLRQLIHAETGPLTRELERETAGFGIGQVPRRLKPDHTTTSVCGFCSTGCGLELHLKDGQAINLSPATDYPVNLGMACPKGWEALTPLAAPDRALQPLVRGPRGKLAPASWPQALEALVQGFRKVQTEHGAESVAFLGTGQIPSEELALFGALAKFGMGMIHGDGNTRQCMASAVVAYKESFGFDAPPYTYADFEESDVLVFVGGNPCIAHPIMWERVLKNRNDPAIVVIDPRKTETAMAATEHLAVRPKSDLQLLYGIASAIIDSGRFDRGFIEAHTSGFDEFARFLKDYSLEGAAAASGVGLEQLERVTKLIAEGKRVSLWWTMGVNQSHEGVRVAQAIIDLALLTGNIGRPGTGPNSITGQCNAMGSRLFSNTTSLLGGRDFESPVDRQDVARILGIDEARIPSQKSWSYDRILEGVLAGKIRGLWIVATNTAHSWINQADAHEILDRLDFLVVQDLYTTTETVRFADVLLPAAGWGEKDGTFINSERRFGLIKKALRAPGEALADFYIFKLVAEAWGVGDLFESWSTPEATFQILKELTRGRPCDITGIEDYQAIDRARGIQWPLPAGETRAPSGEERLFADGKFFTADGRARFIFEAPRPLPEPADARYPLTLLTGRGSSSQWHTQTRTGKSAVLRSLASEAPYVEIHPEDAERLGILPSVPVVVESRRGKMSAIAQVTPAVQPGQVFVPMHYAETNQLTFAAFDPYSRQPAYKACAVRVRRA
jgi:anaerobic selenocysteine-containing dehydrogenase